MITIQEGSIFDADVQALVNPVNCVGVMGKGLALEFKKRFPKNYEFYKQCCYDGYLRPGIVINKLENDKMIFHFPTKDHWKDPSHLDYIRDGLPQLAGYLDNFNYESVALPALGCGLGGLNMRDVLPLIHRAFKDYESIRVVVFLPKGTLNE